MKPELPKKLTARGLSILFGISEQRISQMKRKGILTPDSSNLYDTAQALSVRDLQMTEHGVRVVCQEYSNGTGKVSPAKINPTTALSAEDRDVLGISDVPIAPSPHSVVAQQSRIAELREQKLQAELDRVKTRARRESGELVERSAVQSSFISAGALINTILQNLPAEIASIFADPEKKTEVRHKVQTRVDQVQHALYSALKNYGENDAG